MLFRTSLRSLASSSVRCSSCSALQGSLVAGTWMADLQLAKSQHLMQDALEKEVRKGHRENKVKSTWKKAIKKVQKSSRKKDFWEDTNVEQLVDKISEEGSLQNSFNSGSRPSQPLSATWSSFNFSREAGVESGLSAEELKDRATHAHSDNESLSSLRMGWIDTNDTPPSDSNSDTEKSRTKHKKKKRIKEKNKVKKINLLHRTTSTGVIDDVDSNTSRRRGSETESATYKHESHSKRRLSGFFKRRSSKSSKRKKGVDVDEDNVSESTTRSVQGSVRSLQSDPEMFVVQGSPGPQQRVVQGSPGPQQRVVQGSPGPQQRVVQGSPGTQQRGVQGSLGPRYITNVAGTSELDALSTDDDSLYKLNPSSSPRRTQVVVGLSPTHNTSAASLENVKNVNLPEGGAFDSRVINTSPLRVAPAVGTDPGAQDSGPTSMYGEDGDFDVEGGAAVKTTSVSPEIPVIQVGQSEVNNTKLASGQKVLNKRFAADKKYF